MGKAPKFKNRFLKRTFMAPNAEKWTFSKNDKRACNQPVTHLNFKDDGKKRDVKILNPLQNVCKTCITLSWTHSASIFLEKKPACKSGGLCRRWKCASVLWL
jgi:hypothetical protein